VAYKKYLESLGKNRNVKTANIMQQLAHVDEDVLDLIHCDTRSAAPKGFVPNIEPLADGSKEYTDEWGIRWRMCKDGYYYDLKKSPLSEIETVSELSKIMTENIPVSLRIEGLETRIDEIVEQKKAVFLKGFVPGVMEFAAWLRGYEQFFMDLYSDPDIAKAILDFACEVKLRYWEAALTKTGNKVDVVNESDDLGTQRGPLISPEMYRKVIKPLHKRINDTIKKHSRAKIFLHSCGAVSEFIPDLIDAGFDILNPVQFTAFGMELSELKQKFGADVVFWGGGVDTQQTLPKGTREEIISEVKRNTEILMKDGGYVFAQVHNIQADVPPENIQAMYDAFHECCRY
jgi:uroporphyrinogen decarboxylase